MSAVAGLQLALELLFTETGHVRCGQRLLVDRIFEVIVIQLICWLLDYPREAGVRPGFITGLSDPRMALVQKKLREGQAIKALTQELGYANPSALSRAFSAKVGMSPRDWLARASEQPNESAAADTA